LPLGDLADLAMELRIAVDPFREILHAAGDLFGREE
jgi:hypothetical protein